MGYPHKVCRVTISGTMFSGSEEWSTGFYLGWEDQDSYAPTQAAADQILEAWRTFFTASGSRISSMYDTKQVKLATVNQDGKTQLDQVLYAYPTTAIVGVTGTNTLPPQCSLVASLQSREVRGHAAKGRMYLPGVAVLVDATGHVSGLNATGIADSLKTFYDTLYNDADLPGNIVLASNGGSDSVLTTGKIRRVQTLRVGNVVDTQRRRRNGLVESYTDRSIAGGGV